MKDRFLEFYYENTQKFWGIVIVLAAVLLGWAALSDKNAEKSQKTEESANLLERDVERVHDTFSVLGEYPQGYIEGTVAMEYDVYLKKPFLSTSEFRSAVNSLIAMVKHQYNDEDNFIAGVKLNVYDRYENYEADAQPRATVTYMLAEEDKKKRDDEDEYMEDYDLRWEHTISQTEMPDYDSTYRLSISYKAYDIDNYSPYSDKEYELFRKIMMYKALRGSLNTGISDYMVWELGVPATKIAVFKELAKFMQYGQAYGESMYLYDDNVSKLRKRLAIENPRYLAYIETRKIYDDKLEAKRALVKEKRELYLPVYVAEAQRIVKEVGGEEGITALEEVTNLEKVNENTEIDEGYELPQDLVGTEGYPDVDLDALEDEQQDEDTE